MSQRADAQFEIFLVFFLPIACLTCVVASFGIESQPLGEGMGAVWRTLIGTAIGWVTGLTAGSRAREGLSIDVLFWTMALGAGLHSWGIMFLIVAIDASGDDIEIVWVIGTVLSWLFAFVAFFGTARLVQRRSPRRSLGG